MTTFYMHCPSCGCDVIPRTECGSCRTFAMAKKLYDKLRALVEDGGQIAGTKQIDELVALEFVEWDGYKYDVTKKGLKVLVKMS